MYTPETFIPALQDHIEARSGKERGLYKKAACDLDMTQVELSQIVCGRRRPCAKVLASMGLKKIVMYVKDEK